jgi:Na+/serine symporter
MNFTQPYINNPNSMRLFALFSGYSKKDFSSDSILHLSVELQDEKSDIQKATVSHVPFDEINMIVSSVILSKTKKQTLFAYVSLVLILVIAMWFLLGNIGIVFALILFEPNIQNMIFNFLSEHLLAYHKKSFVKYLESII